MTDCAHYANGRTPPGGPGRARRRRPGVLAIVAGMLFLSALIRVTDGLGAALAETSPQSSPDAPVEPVACAPDAGASALLEALRAREAQVETREGEVLDREKAIELARAEVEVRLADLVTAEENLARTLTIADAAAEEDVARLVAVYERMKPKEAAPLFEEMAPEFAAGFLGRMRPDAAAAVMAGLDPKAAYAISVLLAGRNAAAPEN